MVQIERLQELRGELAEILDGSVPTDLPAELAVAGESGLSEADRGFVAVMGRTLGPAEREVYAGVLRRHDRDTWLDAAFDRLSEDADEQTRAVLAQRMAAEVRASHDEDPGLHELGAHAPKGAAHHVRTMNRALTDLYNPAQLDVLRRLGGLRPREH